MRRLLRRLLLGAATLVAVVAFLAVATPQGQAAVRTALLIPQVLPTIPIKPQPWVTGEPIWEQVSSPTADGQGVADLIRPAGAGKHSAVLFYLGVVVDLPRDDPRIVNLAEGLARSGMVVMIPWLDTQVEQRIVPEDIDTLVRAFEHLQTLEGVDPERMGMGGYCTGASMATVAAQDERIRDDVKFVNFFAGYYDAFDLTRAMGSRSRFYGDDYVAPWNIDKLTYQVFRNQLIAGVTDADERDLLTRVFKQQQQASDVEVGSLSVEATAVYKLLEGVPYEKVDGLMEDLSPKTKEFLRAVSPSTNIDQLKARVLIMHDRADTLVPSEESRRMAEALADRPDTYYTEFSLFQNEIQMHVGDSQSLGPIDFAKEAYKLFMHMYNIMRDIS